MEKLKLYGIKKSKTHSVYYIEKSKTFLEKFSKVLEKLEFQKEHVNSELLSLLGDLDDDYSKKKYSNALYTDKYFYFENEIYKINLFFGKEKILASILTSKNDQGKISKLMFNFCDF